MSHGVAAGRRSFSPSFCPLGVWEGKGPLRSPDRLGLSARCSGLLGRSPERSAHFLPLVPAPVSPDGLARVGNESAGRAPRRRGGGCRRPSRLSRRLRAGVWGGRGQRRGRPRRSGWGVRRGGGGAGRRQCRPGRSHGAARLASFLLAPLLAPRSKERGESPHHRPATALLGSPTVGRHRGPSLSKALETRSAAPGCPGYPRRERGLAGPLRGAARASRSRETPAPPPRRPTSACARGRGAVWRELGSTARRRDPRPASAPRGPAAPAPLPAPHHPALCSPFRFICAPFNFLSPSEKGKANKRASLFLFRACKVEDI